MSFTQTKRLESTYDDALRDLPAALATEGFGVLTSIDVADTLKKKLGVDLRRYTILGACNPPLAYEALSKTLDVGVMLPCNVVVYEDAGHAVVTAIDPMQTVAAADPALAPIAERVRDKLGRVLERMR